MNIKNIYTQQWVLLCNKSFLLVELKSYEADAMARARGRATHFSLMINSSPKMWELDMDCSEEKSKSFLQWKSSSSSFVLQKKKKKRRQEKSKLKPQLIVERHLFVAALDKESYREKRAASIIIKLFLNQLIEEFLFFCVRVNFN